MTNKSENPYTNNTGDLSEQMFNYIVSSDLKKLIRNWVDVDRQLEVISRVEDNRLMAGLNRTDSSDQLKLTLTQSEFHLLESINSYPCRTMGDLLVKLCVWERIRAPQGTDRSTLSLPDQIALSAVDFLRVHDCQITRIIE